MLILAAPEQQQPALAGARNSSTTCSTASFREIFVQAGLRRSGCIAKFTLTGETLTQLRSVTDLMVIG
jgi:hypothetical protein